MALTPETLPRHELTGLPIRVAESDDPGRVGIEGRVVSETTNTLRIADTVGGTDRVWTVPKVGTTFEFAITDDAAGDERSPESTSKLANTQPGSEGSPFDPDRAGEDVTYVTVDGSRLAGRPARRTETTGESPWQ